MGLIRVNEFNNLVSALKIQKEGGLSMAFATI